MKLIERIAPRWDERSIGAILIDEGRLKPEDAERVLRLQHEAGLRFGEAALRLGLVTQADIDFAISRQFDYQYLRRGESRVSEKLAVAYASAGPQLEAMRALRSQLMLRWFQSAPARKCLAVVSAARGDGRSHLAASLAVVFSQFGERTLLIDADLRHPSQHELFGLENRVGLSTVLAGRAGKEAVQRVAALRDLSVLTAGAVPPNPAELLSRPPFQQLLSDAARDFDVVLLDSSFSASSTDAQTVAGRAGAALVLVRKNVTTMSEVHRVCEHLGQAGTTIVGTVLSEF